MHALSHYVPLSGALFEAHFYRYVQFYHVAGLDLVGAGDGRCRIGSGDIMVI
jgi:hypothetical protein